MSPEVAALQEIWSQWRIPSQEKKAFHRTDEWAALKSFRSWLAGSRDASSFDEKLPAHSHIYGQPSTPVHTHKSQLWRL